MKSFYRPICHLSFSISEFTLIFKGLLLDFQQNLFTYVQLNSIFHHQKKNNFLPVFQTIPLGFQHERRIWMQNLNTINERVQNPNTLQRVQRTYTFVELGLSTTYFVHTDLSWDSTATRSTVEFHIEWVCMREMVYNLDSTKVEAMIPLKLKPSNFLFWHVGLC